MKKLDRFRILERIGEGGAAAVYKAEEQLPGGLTRAVALKVFPALTSGDKAGEARFVRELRPLIALDGHPFVVAFHAAGVSDGIPWIATEFADLTLEPMMGELPGEVEDVRRLLENIGGALAGLHSQSPPIVHNDLKPANILIGKSACYKLADFGVASQGAEQRTHAVTTVRYAAPELLSAEFGVVGPASDLYALGHVAYELALGSKNYRRQFAGVFDERTGSKDVPASKWMAWHCSANIAAAPVAEVRKGFPDAMSRVIARLMHKAIESRYASATEMLADLRNAPGGNVGTALPDRPTTFGARRSVEAAPTAAPAMQPARRFGQAPAPAAPPLAVPPPMIAPRPAGAATVYYVRLRDKRTGPFDWAALQRQARQGLISRLHQISTDQANWKPAGSFEGLF